MDNNNDSDNFIKVLKNLKNKSENPFGNHIPKKFEESSKNRIINFWGTYEDLFGEVRCPICLARVKSAKRSINCRHIFCSFCLMKWLQYSRKCPVCRNPIKKIISVDLSEKWVTFQGNLYAKYF